MVILEEADGPAEDPVMLTPATFPAKAFTTLVAFTWLISLAVIPCTEYPKAFSSLFMPSAVSTTSSKALDASSVI